MEKNDKLAVWGVPPSAPRLMQSGQDGRVITDKNHAWKSPSPWTCLFPSGAQSRFDFRDPVILPSVVRSGKIDGHRMGWGSRPAHLVS